MNAKTPQTPAGGEEAPVRREVEMPGRRLDVGFAEALGITLTDEDQERYQATLARIADIENPHPHYLWVEAGRPDRDADVRTVVYRSLMLACGHLIPKERP